MKKKSTIHAEPMRGFNNELSQVIRFEDEFVIAIRGSRKKALAWIERFKNAKVL